MKSCIIIGAGEFTPMDIPVEKGDFVIAADGGYLYCRKLQIEPDYIVGDMDSLPEEAVKEIKDFRERYPERVELLPRMKDDTDTMSAIRIGLARGFRRFRLYAMMGGRLEHTIANIQCLLFLKNRGADGCLLEKGRTVMIAKQETIRFPKEKEGFFSMFALQQRAVGVTIRGMKYPLENAVITDEFPIGISNEFIGEAAEVTVSQGTLLLILSDFSG